jgi:SAM-dependent methyltransferase
MESTGQNGSAGTADALGRGRGLGPDAHPETTAAESHNLSVWRDGNFVKHYVSRSLRPAEKMLVSEYRDSLSGSVLELGCGAGRLTGHLIEIGGSVHGIDLSPAMVGYCREHYPSGSFSVGDLRDLSGQEAQSLDAIVATNNVLDILDDAARRSVLREIRRLLVPGGLLWMSSHNRDAIASLKGPGDIRGRNPVRSAGKLALMPWRVYNRRRLLPLQRFEPGYAIVNDDAHNFRLLHYYISPASQARQLDEEGFALLACRCSDGREISSGDVVTDCVEVHYLARRPAADA